MSHSGGKLSGMCKSAKERAGLRETYCNHFLRLCSCPDCIKLWLEMAASMKADKAWKTRKAA